VSFSNAHLLSKAELHYDANAIVFQTIYYMLFSFRTKAITMFGLKGGSMVAMRRVTRNFGQGNSLLGLRLLLGRTLLPRLPANEI
jgi:hypothetical protein